jgi:uncharacterized membrane-anchored protein
MPHLEIRRVPGAPVGRRWLWLRVFGLVLLGGFLLLVISLPALASENPESSPGLAWYVVLAVVVAAVTSRTYVVVRRSAASKRRALLVAVAAVPGSYCVAVLILWLIVTLSSSA